MAGHVEADRSRPRGVGVDRDRDGITPAHGAEAHVGAPWTHARPLCLPERVHQRGAIEVPVRVAALDDPSSSKLLEARPVCRVLLAPHPADLVVHPCGRRRDGLAIVEVHRPFDGVGVAILSQVLPIEAAILAVERAERLAHRVAVGRRAVELVDRVVAVQHVAEVVGDARTDGLPRPRVDRVVEQAVLVPADREDAVEHLMDGRAIRRRLLPAAP